MSVVEPYCQQAGGIGEHDRKSPRITDQSPTAHDLEQTGRARESQIERTLIPPGRVRCRGRGSVHNSPVGTSTASLKDQSRIIVALSSQDLTTARTVSRCGHGPDTVGMLRSPSVRTCRRDFHARRDARSGPAGNQFSLRYGSRGASGNWGPLLGCHSMLFA